MEEYEVINKLGSGAFGHVVQAMKRGTREVVAIKEIQYDTMSTKDRQMLVNEVNILKTLRSEYIVRYLDHKIDKDGQRLYIIMECCGGGDLQNFIRQKRIDNEFITEDQIWLALTELALALKECHGKEEKVIHRDIKPANVFIDSKGNVKLGDFGLAKKLENDFAQTVCGTPCYMSPELCSHRRYGEKSDIWALGCVIYEMAMKRAPFIARGEEELKRIIKFETPNRIPEKYSDSLWRCILGMLEKDPSKRMSVVDILHSRRVQITAQIIDLRKERKSIRKTTEKLKTKISDLAKRKETLSSLNKAAVPVDENTAAN